jgi:drug/metabolite transporter (DMT)-like permease
MSWIFIALLAPVFFAFANIVDNYLSTKITKGTATLVFYSAVFNILFLPFLFFYGLPIGPSAHEWFLIFLIASLEVLWLFPYYKAYAHDDTSVVASLFSLGKIFVPIFAFFLIGEVLSPAQYIGFLIIILASVLLTVQDIRSLKFNSSLYLMLASSAIVSLQAVLYKYAFESVDWVTGLFWTRVLSFIIVLAFLLHRATRTEVRIQLRQFKTLAIPLVLVELFSFIGMALLTYVLVFQPATVVESIASIQPIVIIILAVLFAKRYPNLFNESIEKRDMWRKVALFILMGVGIAIILV